MSLYRSNLAPVAIVGIGIRLPGGVSTPEQFWDLLISKKDGRCRVPSTRYDVDAFHGERPHQQRVASEYGYFLDHVDLTRFDASFFSAKRAEAEGTDPQQKLLLEVVWECMESAGQADLQGTNTGVYVGVFGEDWHNMQHRDEQTSSAHRVLSAGDYALANRLSYEFDFRGPSMTIRTACSSSLSGLHLACQALRSGDCDAAIVAGSSIIMDPSMTLDMTKQGVLSPTGSCKPFDAAADGFARGEAINAILIKPLDRAIRDGDPIRAVIRSTAVSSDGKTSHMGSPSTEAQEAMIRRAYQIAGIEDFSQTAFFECHGTGTALGDPLEAAAVGNLFGEHGIYMGSVKSNVGHGEGASGLTGLIKGVLALENETIPPNIHFSTPNPKIPFQECRLQVPVEPMPWPKDRHARVSVNSFGIGGANAHVIIESAASFGVSSPSRKLNRGEATTPMANLGSYNCSGDVQSVIEERRPPILPVSAKNLKSLQRRVEELRRYIETHPGCLPDLAYTLGARRTHLPYRSFCVVRDGMVEALEFNIPDKAFKPASGDGKIAYVFTGQGAQWPGMARSLIHSSASFRSDIQDMDAILQKLPDPSGWTIEGLLTSEHDDKDLMDKPEYSQPMCTAIQIALVNFLSHCGINPTAVIGHSSGEIAAAYAAEVLTLPQAIVCAYLRGHVMKSLSKAGAMAAIGMSSRDIQPYLAESVQVACENSPRSVTISGDADAVKKSLDAIKASEPNVLTRLLHVQVAYHSSHMRDVGKVYEDLLMPHLSQETIKPVVPLYSSVSGRAADSTSQFNAAYWRSNLERTVRFHGAVGNLLHEIPDIQVMLEIGPHSALRGPLRQIFQEKRSKKPPMYIPTLVRHEDSAASIANTVGQLYVSGHVIRFPFINPTGSILVDLPTYPWDHDTELWKDSRVSEAWRLRKHSHHELLGARCAESSDFEPIWRNMFHESDVPWLRDHRVGSNVVFPCAGYIAMMGEAIRQTLGSDSYALRNLMVKAALILPEVETIEIMTTMRPSRITELSNSSEWHDISIHSFHGSVWTENCAAQARAGGRDEDTRPWPNPILTQKRQITPEYFYDRACFLGLRYGPRFRGLKDISADTEEYTATASMRNEEAEHEAEYSVHPAVIDLGLQLSAVASCRAITRHMDSIILPVDIRHIAVNPGGPDLIAEANADPVKKTGSIVAVTKEGGQPVIKLEEVKGISFDTGDMTTRKEALDLARVEWLPHVDHVDTGSLMLRRERDDGLRILLLKMAGIGILQTLNVIRSLDNVLPDRLAKYVSWLDQEKEKMRRGSSKILLPEAQQWTTTSPESLALLLDSLLEEVKDRGDAAATNVARVLHEAAQPEIIETTITRERDSAGSLIHDDRLAELYRFYSQTIRMERFFHLCGHAKPNMNVLEIGAGTGSTTEQVLSALVSKDGIRMYSQYTFSDTSPRLFSAATKRFRDSKGIEYKTLDIQQDPSEQGFELGSFDLIIASDALDATLSSKTALRNVRSLLREGGRFYVVEPLKPFAAMEIGFVVGCLPERWAGEEDGCCDGPSSAVEAWNRELQAAGFSGTDAVVWDEEPPYRTCAHIVSRAVPAIPKASPEAVVFLYREENVEFADRLAGLLEKKGIAVHWSRLGSNDQPPNIMHVILTIDLEGPFLGDISVHDYETFLQYLSKPKIGILWLTRSAQVGCTDPRYGLLDSLRWAQHEAAEVRADDVEIDIQCVGLNFRDIMVAMGIVPKPKDYLGLEATGIVTRVGRDVKHVQVGDRVFAISSGLLSTRKVIPGELVVKMPEGLSMEQGATMPIVFATAIYSLMKLGRLGKGQTILIHSGTGGVGQAAIRICQMIGAEIFTTVSKEEKVEYLMENYNIPRDHIFDSRSSSFVNGILQATGGRGVDVVLNSLSGELLHASWQCVAKCGKMMEIGKRDILEHGHLSLDMLQHNRTFYGIDMEGLFQEEPGSLRALIDQLLQFYHQGYAQPVQPIHGFPATKISEAIRFMKKGEHIGKIVITMPADSKEIPAIKVSDSALLSDTATYLVVGGLGGLGKAVARWMVERGAKNFSFLSRSAGKSEKDRAFLEELRSQGCHAIAVAGSVTEMADVKRAIDLAKTPIAGVLLMSMVLRDRPFLNTSYADWKLVHDCKVKGAWNLHNALSGVKLDFFILTASIAGAVGHPGQANYASANTFLDSFAQYRQGLGLPCSVIDLGGMEGIGYLGERPAKLNVYRSFGLYILHEQHLVDAIHLAMLKKPRDAEDDSKKGPFDAVSSTNHFAVGLNTSKPLSDPANRSIFKGDIRLSLYHNITPADKTAPDRRDGGLRELMGQAEVDPQMLNDPETLRRVTLEIGRALFTFLLLPEESLDVTLSWTSIGIDSLVSIEIRNWWRKVMGLDVTVLEIMNAGTTEGLGKLAIALLKERYGVDESSDRIIQDIREEDSRTPLE